MRPLDRAMVITAGTLVKTIFYRQDAKTRRKTKLKPPMNADEWFGFVFLDVPGALAVQFLFLFFLRVLCVLRGKRFFFSAHAADPRAELRQLLLDPFVPAVEVIHPLHRRRAARDQPRHD